MFTLTKFRISKFSHYLLLIYLFCYISGPAVINIYLTILSIISLFYMKNFSKTDYPIIFFFIFLFYILIRDLFIGTFNYDYISFIRFFLIFFLLNKFKEQIFIKSKILYFLIILFIFDTIFQYTFGYNLFGFQKFGHDRLTSFFDDEPIIGSFLMKFLVIYVTYFFFTNNFSILNLLLIFSIYVCIFISGERMAFIQSSMVISLIFFLKLIDNFSNNKKLIILFIVAFSVFIALVPKDRYLVKTKYEIINVVNNGIDIKQNSISDYLLNFKSGYDLWKLKPIFGNGYRYYNTSCKKVITNHIIKKGCSTHPHNIAIETLSDHGIVGLILLYLFFSSLFFKSYSKFKLNKSLYILIFSVLIFPLFTSQSIYSSYYGSIFFLFIYLLYLDRSK